MAVPEAGPTWWLDQVVPAFDPDQAAQDFLVADVLPCLTDRWRLDPKQLAVLGIGMGGQGALLLSYRHPQRFPWWRRSRRPWIFISWFPMRNRR